MYVSGELKCVVKEVCADRLHTSLENPWPHGAQFFKSPTWLIPRLQVCWLEARDLWR